MAKKTLTFEYTETNDDGGLIRRHVHEWEVPEDRVTHTIYWEAMLDFLNGLGFRVNQEDILFYSPYSKETETLEDRIMREMECQ